MRRMLCTARRESPAGCAGLLLAVPYALSAQHEHIDHMNVKRTALEQAAGIWMQTRKETG
jgi:hypothetical protein